jgi:WD40 repeat protein
VAVADERKVQIHDADSGELLHELLGHTGNIGSMAVSSDGRTLATSSRLERTVKLWHIASGQHLTNFPINERGWQRCAFSEHDQWLAFRLDDDHIRMVRLR